MPAWGESPGPGSTVIRDTGTAVAALTEDSSAIGGTSDGDLPDLGTPSAAGNTAAVRECAEKINELILALQAANILP